MAKKQKHRGTRLISTFGLVSELEILSVQLASLVAQAGGQKRHRFFFSMRLNINLYILLKI